MDIRDILDRLEESDLLENRLVRLGLYVGTGILVFSIAFFATLPDERLGQIASVQTEALLDHRYNVEVESLSLWRFSGFKLYGIAIEERFGTEDSTAGDEDSENPAGESGDGPFRIVVNSAGLRLSPFGSLLNLGVALAYDVDVGSGTLGGVVGRSTGSRFAAIEASNIQLRESNTLQSLINLPVSGLLGIDGRLEFDANRPVARDGYLDFDITRFVAGPGKIESRQFGPAAFIDIPETVFGNIAGRFDVEQREEGSPPIVNLERFEIREGRDLRGEAWGEIALGRTIRSARSELEMRVQFQRSYIEENDLDSLLNMQWFRTGRSGDWYGFALDGTLGNPNFKGDSEAAEGPSTDDEESSPGK